MATQDSETTPTAVLFDMGGVLVELGPLDEFLGVAIPADEFWPRWLASPSVRSFERGQCGVDDFGAGLAREFSLDLTPEEVIDRFRLFPRGLFAGAAELVAEVGLRFPTGVLSNTNRLHWDEQRDGDQIRGLFDHSFLSYELGLVKPDAAIFEAVAAELDRDPGEILFIDDNQINVDGARSAGFQAELARGVAEARQALVASGVLEPDT